MAKRFNEEIESLKDGGATVVTITPDDASIAAFGANLMDFRRRSGRGAGGPGAGAWPMRRTCSPTGPTKKEPPPGKGRPSFRWKTKRGGD